jgi:hypothetical protein
MVGWEARLTGISCSKAMPWVIPHWELCPIFREWYSMCNMREFFNLRSKCGNEKSMTLSIKSWPRCIGKKTCTNKTVSSPHRSSRMWTNALQLALKCLNLCKDHKLYFAVAKLHVFRNFRTSRFQIKLAFSTISSFVISGNLMSSRSPS